MKRFLIIFFRMALLLFLFANIMAAFHAYKFTHFEKDAILKAKNPEDLNFTQKLNALFFGVSLPRPETDILPCDEFRNVMVENEIACWEIKVPNEKGIAILFHGYGSNKASVLGKAQEFNRMGYTAFLVDFRGSGGSAGSKTTIGFNEAKDVKACYDYIKSKNPKSILLCGTSMGAVAIMKCVSETNIQPNGIVLECPFGSMKQTVSNRFSAMGIPSFPLADLLVFYGGIINGFWAFDHNPINYAKNIHVPTLLLCGGNDERVTQQEIDDIFQNINAPKEKIIYPLAKHESYLNQYREAWREDVMCFIENL